jgi:uncharacterized protein (TIRG00374 family)
MYKKRTALFVIGILLLAALFFTIDYNEFFRIASNISPGWMMALLALQLLIMFLTVLRWYVLVRRYRVSFMNSMYTSLIALMVNNITPMSMVGGEPVRAYVISKIDRIRLENAFATVFVDLFVSMVPVLFLYLLSILLVLNFSMDVRIAWILAAAGIFTMALILASLSLFIRGKPSLRFLDGILNVLGKIRPLKNHAKRLRNNIEDLFMSFHRGIQSTITDKWTLLAATAISFLIWALTLARIYLIFAALDVSAPYEVIVIVYSILIMVSILPLLPGALGMWEWVGAGLFTYFGIPLEMAVTIILIDRILFYWIPIFTGFLASLHVGLNIMRLLDRQ